jgi:hypothetical protein
MQVTEVRWLAEHQLLLYGFDTGAWLTYGIDVLPGTDVLTYRFVRSKGFNGDKEAYKEGKELAYAYSRGLGFKGGAQGHFESFTSNPV